MVDFQAGYKKTDTNYEQMCQVFGACLENIYPDRYSPVAVATAQDGGVLQDYFIRDASFVKLREVALSFDAPQSLTRYVGAKGCAITLTGRNLATHTKYTGLDPENSISAAGGMSGNIGSDQTEYPQFTSVVLGFRFTY
jgi:hypothetical protein